jgi:aminoglycoside 6'-N-acetyltransferase I
LEILRFDRSNNKYINEAAQLLAESFPQAYWDSADEEMQQILEDGKLAFMATENESLIGFAGAMPQYGTTGWELHPLVVRADHFRLGVGTRLVLALEEAAVDKGCITMYLGTDDEFGKTSLSDTDLFEDTFMKIESIRNLQGHPFTFYQKLGYKIVGVIPDANGIGKPDIFMAKRIGQRGNSHR